MRDILNYLREKHLFFEILYLFIGTIILAMVFLPVFSHQNYNTQVGKFHFNLTGNFNWQKLKFEDRGLVHVNFKPFGRVIFKVHDSPLILRISPETINENTLRDITEDVKKAPKVIDMTEKDLRGALIRFIVRCILIVLIISFVWSGVNLKIITPSRIPIKERLKNAALIMFVCLFASIVFIMGFCFWTYATLEESPYRNYRVIGSLGYIEKIEPQIRKFSENVENYMKNFVVMMENVYESSKDMGSINGNYKKNYTGILLVSDLHNNLSSIEFILERSKKKDINFVIFTGDFTTQGTSFEADIVSRLRDVKKPTLIIGGNHDSPGVIEEFKDSSNIIILDNRENEKTINESLNIVHMEGLRIAGVNDPFMYKKSSFKIDSKEYDDKHTKAVKSSSEIVEKRYRKSKKIDVFVVHSIGQAGGLIGKVPVILSGHTHILGFQKIADTWIINSGTIGAIPPYYPIGKDKLTYQVLFFEGSSISAIDDITIKLNNENIRDSDYSLKHTNLN